MGATVQTSRERLENLRQRRDSVNDRLAGAQREYAAQLASGGDARAPKELAELQVELQGLSMAVRQLEGEVAAAEAAKQAALRVAELNEFEAAVKREIDAVEAAYRNVEEAVVRIVDAEQQVAVLRDQISQRCSAVGLADRPMRQMQTAFPRPIHAAMAGLRTLETGARIDLLFKEPHNGLESAKSVVSGEAERLRAAAEAEKRTDSE